MRWSMVPGCGALFGVKGLRRRRWQVHGMSLVYLLFH